jgi:hypothetical protein
MEAGRRRTFDVKAGSDPSGIDGGVPLRLQRLPTCTRRGVSFEVDLAALQPGHLQGDVSDLKLWTVQPLATAARATAEPARVRAVDRKEAFSPRSLVRRVTAGRTPTEEAVATNDEECLRCHPFFGLSREEGRRTLAGRGLNDARAES